ncbi:MAG TPA: hypothetical protein VKD69_08065 [Vicinamibacterales bacterium]|nr:hypothetical protein [Vicinamibacterales bacterium]
MPDPKEMSGIPRPVDDLPNGAISVRLIRGALSNNIAGHPVKLVGGGKEFTVETDENGRAQFNDVPPGSPVKAVADVDGEHLESREFPAPTRGGIRLMLVATDKSKPAAAAAPAVSGTVTIGSQSRIVVQPNDENVEFYYLLDVSNTSTNPVNPATPFVINLPKRASGATIMEGSSPQAKVKGSSVVIDGPVAPGHTFVQAAYMMPGEGGTVDLAQIFPASIEQLSVIVKKVGDTTLQSPQLNSQRPMQAENDVFIAAGGGELKGGQPLHLTISGFPYHSTAPRMIALMLALGIALIGGWAATRPAPDSGAAAAERKRLIARREKLFADLVRLENDRRNGRLDDRRYGTRREELVAALEQIYSALDSHDAGPGPADRAGLAA